jgi:hypothetical protein
VCCRRNFRQPGNPAAQILQEIPACAQCAQRSLNAALVWLSASEPKQESLQKGKKQKGTRMRKSWVVLLLVLGLLIVTVPAKAHELTSAQATVTCSSYTITFTSADLATSDNYTISWTIFGLGPDINGSINFHNVSGTVTNGGSGTFSPVVGGPFLPTGNATFTDTTTGESNTLDIGFSPSSITCPGPPPPPPCTASATNSSNFNGTAVPEGSFIWFSANFKASNVPNNGTTIDFTNGNISFTAGGTPYNIPVPNAKITFSSSATCSSTTFDSGSNTWMTTVPISGDDEIFLTGVAWAVPSGGLPGGANPVNFSGTYSSEDNSPGLSIQMKWGAAAYSNFTTDYNALQVKAGHQTACGLNSSDHAGTPEGTDNTNTPWKKFVVGGARGGGGSNFTGSWSGTLSIHICP